MNAPIDEIMLTAYALNELSPEDRRRVEAYLAEHPEAMTEVEAIRQAAGLLQQELAAELREQGAVVHEPAIPAPIRLPRSRRVETMLAIAASVALVAGSVAVMIHATANSRPAREVAISSELRAGSVDPSTAAQTKPAMPRPSDASAQVKSMVMPDRLQALHQAQVPVANQTKGTLFGRAAAERLGEGPGVAEAPNFDLQSIPATAGKDDSKLETTNAEDQRPKLDATMKEATGRRDLGALSAADSQKKQSDDVGLAPFGSGKGGQKVATGKSLALDAESKDHALKDQLSRTLSKRMLSPSATPAPVVAGRVAQSPLVGANNDNINTPESATDSVLLVPAGGIDRTTPPSNTEAYDRVVENAFLTVGQNPLSTFSIDVDTASYANVRRFLTQGQLPPKDAVRIEEMVNYFPYAYTVPKDNTPFAAHIEVAGCPWNSDHRLVRVGIKGKVIADKDRPASNLVFLIDVSGSMDEPNKLPWVRESLRKLVNKLDARDHVAIAVYAGNAGLVLPSTAVGGFTDNDANELWHSKYEPMFKGLNDGQMIHGRIISEDQARAQFVEEVSQLKQQRGGRQKILAAIDHLEAGGSTNGGQGIELAYGTAQSAFIKNGINRVILATDGDFNVGVTNQGDLTRLIEDKAKGGVFLSVLGFGMGNVKDSTMEKLADQGNGNYAYIDSMQEANKVLVEQMNSTLVTIAKDVKIQVEFNPAKVGSYRLIGYEKRMLKKEDFNDDKKDAGEIGAGHTITALYEVTPAGEKTGTPSVDPLKYQPVPAVDDSKYQSIHGAGPVSQEMLTLKIRYKAPDAPIEQGTSKLLEFPLVDEGKTYAQTDEDFKFAAAVASFGMVLRDSQYKGNATLNSVVELAQEGKGPDASGYRAEFVELVKRAKAISGK